MEARCECKYCGIEAKGGKGALGTHYRMTKSCREAFQAELLPYLTTNKSNRDIARAVTCSSDTVSRYRRFFGLGPRARGRAFGSKNKPEPQFVAAPNNSDTLGEQLLEAAFKYRDKLLLVEGRIVELEEKLQKLEYVKVEVEAYKQKYNGAIQERAKSFIEHGEGRLK